MYVVGVVRCLQQSEYKVERQKVLCLIILWELLNYRVYVYNEMDLKLYHSYIRTEHVVDVCVCMYVCVYTHVHIRSCKLIQAPQTQTLAS